MSQKVYDTVGEESEKKWGDAVAANGFYKLIATYSDADRVTACTLACSLEQQEQHSIVSVEMDGVRKVWAEIRSLIHPVPLIRLEALSPAIA